MPRLRTTSFDQEQPQSDQEQSDQEQSDQSQYYQSLNYSTITVTHTSKPPETETALPTANAVASSEYSSTNSNISLLPLVLLPIIAVFALGGLYFIWHRCYKRKKAKQVAPSAEFQKYRRRSIPLADVEGRSAVEAAAVEGRMSRMDRQSTLYAYHDNGGAKLEGHNNGSPPPFAPGLFEDPIFEKGLAISLGNHGRRER